MNAQIAPSILAADFTKLGDEVAAVLDGGADLIHFDVMDNHFVPNLTFGPPVLAALRTRFPETPFDVHLMVQPAERLVDEFIELGATMISVHPETCENARTTLARIRASGTKAGAVLNPDVGTDALEPLWNELDHVLVMSVNPGFGGQSFMPEVLPKLTRVQDESQRRGLAISLEIDGGIAADTIGHAAAAGAEIFVAGSAIFKSDDYGATISELRAQAT